LLPQLLTLRQAGVEAGSVVSSYTDVSQVCVRIEDERFVRSWINHIYKAECTILYNFHIFYLFGNMSSLPFFIHFFRPIIVRRPVQHDR
jgi:hypothetical protein